jgi:dTMP kinase
MSTQQRRGVLVAFEGIDGAGKTTQVRLLEARLAADAIPFVSTKEPTTGPWGQKIRTSAQTGRMSPADELDAFIRDRREHVTDLLEPSLAAGKVVIVDRYYLSTVAYQGARGLDPAHLLTLNAFAPPPDVLVILDVDPALGLDRIRQRGDRADLFELESELAKARAIFRALDLPNLHIFDATRPIADLHVAISATVLAAWRQASAETHRS